MKTRTLWLAVMVAAGAVFAGGGCAVTDKQSSVGQYVDDATITTRVKARFAEDKAVSAMRLNVETLRGVVQLSGFAESSTEKSRAGEIAGNVPGVQRVINDIVVRPPRS